MMAGVTLTMTNGTLNVMSGDSNQMLNAARSILLGGVNNVMSSSYGSAIIGGSNVASIRMNTSTGSVALPRDAAYTGSANYTLFTQNIDASGSVSVTGSATITGDVKFASGSNKTMGTVALDGANPGTATVSNTLVTANSLIYLTKQTNNHPNAGPVVVSSKGTGTFTITSNHNGDADTVAYLIINPA